MSICCRTKASPPQDSWLCWISERLARLGYASLLGSGLVSSSSHVLRGESLSLAESIGSSFFSPRKRNSVSSLRPTFHPCFHINRGVQASSGVIVSWISLKASSALSTGLSRLQPRGESDQLPGYPVAQHTPGPHSISHAVAFLRQGEPQDLRLSS